MSFKTKRRIHADITVIACLGFVIAVSYVWSQINANNAGDRVIEIEIAADDEAVNNMLTEAYQLRAKGKNEQAIAKFQSILEGHPDTNQKPKIKFYIATCYSQIGQPKKAVELYRQIISENPDYQDMATVLYNLALAYEWTKNTEAALATYDQIAQKFPHSDSAAQALFTKGQLYYYQGKFERAIPEFSKVADDAKNQSNKWKLLVLERMGLAYMKLKNYDKAVATLQEKLKLFGSNARTLHVLGKIHREKGEYQKAMEAFRQVAKEHPNEKYYAPESQYLIGDCLEELKDVQGSTVAFQEVITQYPDSQTAGEANLRINMIQGKVK